MCMGDIDAASHRGAKLAQWCQCLCNVFCKEKHETLARDSAHWSESFRVVGIFVESHEPVRCWDQVEFLRDISIENDVLCNCGKGGEVGVTVRRCSRWLSQCKIV